MPYSILHWYFRAVLDHQYYSGRLTRRLYRVWRPRDRQEFEKVCGPPKPGKLFDLTRFCATVKSLKTLTSPPIRVNSPRGSFCQYMPHPSPRSVFFNTTVANADFVFFFFSRQISVVTEFLIFLVWLRK